MGTASSGTVGNALVAADQLGPPTEIPDRLRAIMKKRGLAMLCMYDEYLRYKDADFTPALWCLLPPGRYWPAPLCRGRTSAGTR